MTRYRELLGLLGRGWYLLPLHTVVEGLCSCGNAECASPGKHPIASLVPHGLLDATNDPEVLGRWVARDPRPNFGARTGMESGFDVLDVDDRHGGWTSLARLTARHGCLPGGPVSATGGEGGHYLFAATGLGNTVGGRRTLPAGLDWRGRNGYIVIPPSVHASGTPYEWAVRPGEVPIPPAPPWLLALLDPPRPPRPIAQPVKRGRGYGEAALAGEVEAVRMAVEGTRNATLYEAALKIGSLVAGGLLDAHRAVGAIVDAGLACGLGETEVVGTVRSGFTAGMANPRAVAS